MDVAFSTFWILFFLILFALLIFIAIFIFSALNKRRLERRMDEIYFEVRGLNLRVTVVETRLDERTSVQVMRPQLPSSTKGKRGRPRKIDEEEE